MYAYNSSGPLLPLGQGTMTLNAHGVPIVVVCTKADQMDAAGGTTAGIKGNAWEERCDWVQQVLRTVCLACAYRHSQLPTFSCNGAGLDSFGNIGKVK